MTSAPLNISELDTDKLKSNFITFLKSQPIFKDYSYEGSNINVLLDILSKNSYLHSFLLNMTANESFLDTAVLRDSIVSHAKHLNYVPRSVRSSSAPVKITITIPNEPSTVFTIPKETSFTSRIDNDVFTFVTDKPYSVSASSYIPSTNSYVYTFDSIEIHEGNYVTETFAVDSTITDQRFVLTNKNIDTESISVSVINSNTDSTNTTFSIATSLLNVTRDSEIFFLQAGQSERYEVVFGDGILGKKPENGNIISVSYRVSRGDEANGCNVFKLASNAINGYTQYTIETLDQARGGAAQESISSIKYTAPRHYQTQERAITTQDFETILYRQFPEIRTLNVYGGEEIYPPQYGKVVIAIDLVDADGIPDSKKIDIINYIRPKTGLTTGVIIIDPDFSYIFVDTTVEYSLNISSLSVQEIKTAIINSVSQYNQANLEDFDATFRYSKLLAAIDAADASIISTNTSVKLFKKVVPTLNTSYSKTLEYQNQLVPGSIESTGFTFNGISSFLIDDGNGSLSIVTTINNINSTILPNVGTINYTTGQLIIRNLNISAFSGDSLKIYAKTVEQDITSVKNTILQIAVDEFEPNVIAVQS